jgi:hypothetical protein
MVGKKEDKGIYPGKPNPDGSVPLVTPPNVKIEVLGPVKRPTMSDSQFDPFEPFKTEPDKYHYRALNIRPQNMRVRKAEGYETIPDSDYGDLVLGKIPKEEHDRRIAKEEAKTQRMHGVAVENFKQEAEKFGVKTFEE